MSLKFRFCYGVLFLLFSFSMFPSIAASFPTADTSIPPRKPHKLTRQQFLERYGTDDSSRALINYYFPERNAAVILTVYSGGSLALAGLLAGIILSNPNDIEAGLGNFFALLILLIVVFATAPLLLVGAALLLRFSRKRLYAMLQAYHTGSGMLRRITRKKSFLRLLEKERIKTELRTNAN